MEKDASSFEEQSPRKERDWVLTCDHYHAWYVRVIGQQIPRLL
jgi:hypothetical protein